MSWTERLRILRGEDEETGRGDCDGGGGGGRGERLELSTDTSMVGGVCNMYSYVCMSSAHRGLNDPKAYELWRRRNELGVWGYVPGPGGESVWWAVSFDAGQVVGTR